VPGPDHRGLDRPPAVLDCPHPVAPPEGVRPAGAVEPDLHIGVECRDGAPVRLAPADRRPRTRWPTTSPAAWTWPGRSGVLRGIW
jgi:hypothetical protein